MKLQQKVIKKYAPLFQGAGKARYFFLMGGRGGGRSTAGSQYALARLVGDEYFRCAIMRFVLTDVRNSIFQDILDRIEENGLEEKVKVREHALTFQYGKNKISGIGFRKSSGDQKSKLKSLSNFNVIIIEEADEINEEDFMQLDDSLRTLKSDIMIIFMLNPPQKKHWIIKRWFNLVDVPDIPGFYRAELKESVKHNTVYIHTTYRDNVMHLNETTVANFEAYKSNRPEHYYNMIKGLVSEGTRGRIFKNWQTCTREVFDQLPFPSFYGLDFGFSNDPTALVEIKMHNNKVWFHELLYETGLTNKMIAKRFELLGVSRTAPIYGDNSEPKSIEEIREEGYNVLPAEKGPGSVNAGIDMLLDMEVFYTEESENMATESQEYKWSLDRDKNPTNTPEDKNNHLMDGGRYGVFTHSRQGYIGFV